MHGKVPVLDWEPEMFLQRITARTGDLDHITDAHTTMFARLNETLDGQIGQAGKYQLLAFDFFGKASRLLLERS